MFRELGKLKDAERLLRQGKFCEVLTLVRDPEIREHKRAHDCRREARKGLLDDARSDLGAGRIPAAARKVRMALDDETDPEATALDSEIRSAASRAGSEAHDARRALREARWHDEHGDRGQARRLVERFETPEVASFVRGLDAIESAERAQRDGILSALERGTSPDGLRARLRDFRHAVRDKKLLVEIHARALDAAAGRKDPAELAGLVADVRASGLDVPEAFDRAAKALVAAARLELENGTDPGVALDWLRPFPAHTDADAEGTALKLACWAHRRARAMAARGHLLLAAALAAEAAAVLPGAAALSAEGLGASARRIAAAISEAEDLVASGSWEKARDLLEEASRAEPEALVLADWSEALVAANAEAEALASRARAALDAGDLRKARRAALELRLRAPKSAALASLTADIARRDEESQRAAIDSERQMLRGSVARVAPLDASGLRAVPDFDPAPGLVLPGDPFILRIENEGDWLVHPGKRLTIGNQANGEADLQVLAAIGAKHATIERIERPGEAASWRIVAGPGQKVAKNGRPVTETDLANGDRVQLGHALTFTFHRPNPANSTAALRLHGDFSIQGCTRLILFSETGRKGSILLAPGSDGHAPLRSVEARLEIFRTDEGEDAGELFARSPQGVAAGDAPERAQVRVRASETLSVGILRVHVDSAARRNGPGK